MGNDWDPLGRNEKPSDESSSGDSSSDTKRIMKKPTVYLTNDGEESGFRRGISGYRRIMIMGIMAALAGIMMTYCYHREKVKNAEIAGDYAAMKKENAALKAQMKENHPPVIKVAPVLETELETEPVTKTSIDAVVNEPTAPPVALSGQKFTLGGRMVNGVFSARKEYVLGAGLDKSYTLEILSKVVPYPEGNITKAKSFLDGCAGSDGVLTKKELMDGAAMRGYRP